ncbi:hypothetical protein RJZ56_000024 [Blastomyces dermatitidis]
MNSHLLPYPYNQTTTPPVISCGTLADNHDLVLDPDFARRFPSRLSPAHSKQSLLDSLDWMHIIYLQDRSITLTFPHGRKLNVYGSPHTPEFGVWAFQYPPIGDVWTGRIPDDADVVVLHGPPLLYCDVERTGDGYLLRELRRVKPQLSVFGHIHDGYGVDRLVHDRVQNARDEIYLHRSGLSAIFRMSFWMTVAWVRMLLGLPQPLETILINAAIAPGANILLETRRRPLYWRCNGP